MHSYKSSRIARGFGTKMSTSQSWEYSWNENIFQTLELINVNCSIGIFDCLFKVALDEPRVQNLFTIVGRFNYYKNIIVFNIFILKSKITTKYIK